MSYQYGDKFGDCFDVLDDVKDHLKWVDVILGDVLLLIDKLAGGDQLKIFLSNILVTAKCCQDLLLGINIKIRITWAQTMMMSPMTALLTAPPSSSSSPVLMKSAPPTYCLPCKNPPNIISNPPWRCHRPRPPCRSNETTRVVS